MKTHLSITANGRPYQVPVGTTLRQFVESRGQLMERVVCERNQQALTPAEARTVVLADGDSLEIIRIVAGG